MNIDPKAVADHWGQIIAAIGALGTAAFGLVDAAKVFGLNAIGFNAISRTFSSLTPPPAAQIRPAFMIDTLRANWVNGTDLASQKAIAKSLIKLYFQDADSAVLANRTGLPAGAAVAPGGADLPSIAADIKAGSPLSQAQSNVYGQFDLIVTAMLDRAYQRGDHDYRHWTRIVAMAVAVALAFTGGNIVQIDWPICVLAGLLATPLAPVAKDLSTALATAVNTMQLVKKA